MTKKNERAVLEFSGASTWDADELGLSLARAARADVTLGGYLIYACDPTDDVLDDHTLKYVKVLGAEVVGSTRDPADLAALMDALAARDVTDFLCMCTGDLAIEFFDATGTLTDVVRVDLPSGIEWPRWPGRASLVDAGKLHAWLQAHSISRSGH
ncbi:hypothetical protein [Cellulomonas sp. SLBN-39]|uniref:hypothetical protein n=1 Tax=Cellulomonas sp. SLBN-39 TaxID=2768446 RepID=UPI0011548FB9|nr:hypothetical protein [Cellulomonas sp. SLBN-39]TQL02682.1 hypothetical protein FBY24_1762 [Cellulomonas sp. SLBN-39]